MKRLLALALCALFAMHAGARTLYVDAKRPNNSGSGLSAKKAKKTLQAAINVAKKGDTILVYPGTYAPIKTNNKKITIKSVKGSAKTKIVKTNAKDQKVALAQLGKPYSIYLDTSGTKGKSGIYTKGTATAITGFLLDGMNRSIGSYGQLIGISGGTATACTIQRIGNKFADTFGGFPFFAWDCHPVANAKLIGCTLKNNKASAICLGYGGPAESDSPGVDHGGAATTFLRCKIQNNDCHYGIGESASLVNCLVTGNIVTDELFDDNQLVNCTVSKNTAYMRWDDQFSDDSKFYNCILRNNYIVPSKEIKTISGYGYYDADGNYIGWRGADETSFYVEVESGDGEWTSVEVSETTLATYYPGFTREESSYTSTAPGAVKKLHNVDSGNTYKNTDKTNKNPRLTSAYKLKKGSYCINKGKLTKAQKKLVGTKDLAGKKRIKGKAIDRGCYEY